MPEPEKVEIHSHRFLEEHDLFEFESNAIDEAGRTIDHCWARDIERLDEIIGQYLPIAQSAEHDFDRALKAAYIVLELIEMQTTLLEF
jgi:hypothetical protein